MKQMLKDTPMEWRHSTAVVRARQSAYMECSRWSSSPRAPKNKDDRERERDVKGKRDLLSLPAEVTLEMVFGEAVIL